MRLDIENIFYLALVSYPGSIRYRVKPYPYIRLFSTLFPNKNSCHNIISIVTPVSYDVQVTVRTVPANVRVSNRGIIIILYFYHVRVHLLRLRSDIMEVGKEKKNASTYLAFSNVIVSTQWGV